MIISAVAALVVVTQETTNKDSVYNTMAMNDNLCLYLYGVFIAYS